jgi:hypothetical protein
LSAKEMRMPYFTVIGAGLIVVVVMIFVVL